MMLPVDSLHKGQWRGALMFSLICAWTNGWANNRDAGDLRLHRAHYDVTVIIIKPILLDLLKQAWHQFQIYRSFFTKRPIWRANYLTNVHKMLTQGWLLACKREHHLNKIHHSLTNLHFDPRAKYRKTSPTQWLWCYGFCRRQAISTSYTNYV